MAFPPRFEGILDKFGVAPDTKAALLDMYLHLGSGVLAVFPELADRFESPADITPEHLVEIRPLAIRAYLEECHGSWLARHATPSFYKPRALGGRASGVVTPHGAVTEDAEGFPGEVARATRRIVGTDQPVPKGLLLVARGAHYGGLESTVSFDIACEQLEDALAVGLAAGRQHTVPGSIGESSASLDEERRLALLWETQPNAYKPSDDRNREIGKVFRRNRNWHVATSCAALLWLSRQDADVFVLRGRALKATHEVNPLEPVTEAIEQMHDRTVARVVEGLGAALRPPDDEEAERWLATDLLLTGLRRFVESEGMGAALLRVEMPAVAAS
jgi:hypothetical protein